MKIRTIWEHSGSIHDAPWLVAAVDEYTIDEHCGLPEFYAKELKDGRKELVLFVPESAVRNLFKTPSVVAEVDE